MKNLAEAKAKIEAGAKFNGQVYTKNAGQNVDVFIYLDGKIHSFGRVFKKDAQETKDAVYAALFPSVAKSTTKTAITDLVDFHNYSEGQD